MSMVRKSKRGVLLVVGVFIVGLTAMGGMFLARWLLPPPPKLPLPIPPIDQPTATRPATRGVTP